MTQVNLLPPQILQRKKTRQVTAAVVVGAIAAIVMLGFVYFLQAAKLSRADRELAVQKGVNAGLQTQISELQRFQELKVLLSEREGRVLSTVQNQVLWSGTLHDISMVIPGQLYLTSLTGTLGVATTQTGDAGAPAAPALSGGLVGNIQFQGVSFDHPTIAQWLTRLEEVNGWVNAWISNSSKSVVNGVPVVQFTGSIDLSTDASTEGRPT